MSKELKLMVLNTVIDILPKTHAEYENGHVSMYVCDVIDEVSSSISDRHVGMGVEGDLTRYIRMKINDVFSVFEFLDIDTYGGIRDEDYQKAYDFRIEMLKEMIEKVEKDEL